MMLSSVVVLTVGLLFSTRLGTLPAGIVVVSLFGLAWLAGFIEMLGAALGNPAMQNLGIVVSLVLPGDALWRAASYYVQSPAIVASTGAAGVGLPMASTVPPTAPFLLWSSLHPLVMLLGAIGVFSRRDL